MPRAFRGVRLDEDDWRALAVIALRLSTPEKRVTASELVRQAVTDYLATHKTGTKATPPRRRSR